MGTLINAKSQNSGPLTKIGIDQRDERPTGVQDGGKLEPEQEIQRAPAAVNIPGGHVLLPEPATGSKSEPAKSHPIKSDREKQSVPILALLRSSGPYHAKCYSLAASDST